MSNKLAEANTLSKVLISGDLGGLSPEQRVSYNQKVCESLGLNPLTNPFEYIRLNGKMKLYAKKDCTDQLRSIYKVSIEILGEKTVGDVLVVKAKATTPTGRCDESFGSVKIGGLKGDALANAYMKAETKAKRRVTLSICGLGMLDETELETIEGIHKSRTSSLNDRLQLTERPTPQKEKTKTMSAKTSQAQSAPISPKPEEPQMKESLKKAVEEMGLKMREPDDPPAKKPEKPDNDPGQFQIKDGWGQHGGRRLRDINPTVLKAYLPVIEKKAETDEYANRVATWMRLYVSELDRKK
jgi:hypothetical protein